MQESFLSLVRTKWRNAGDAFFSTVSSKGLGIERRQQQAAPRVGSEDWLGHRLSSLERQGYHL